MRLAWLTVAIITTLARLAAGADARPNILFALSDDQTWLHTSFEGDPAVKTPVFDRVAREGVYFSRAFCAASSCSPSRAAILTGQPIWRLGSAAWITGPLHPSYTTYVDELEKAGYAVGLSGKGWGPGPFKEYGRSRNPAGPTIGSPKSHVANFKKLLETSGDKPFCFWFGSTEPHRPFAPGSGVKAGIDLSKIRVPAQFPDTPEVRADIADYLAEIQTFDRDLAGMMAELQKRGQLDNTLIIVTSDNGMDFPRAKATLYDFGCRMPMAVRWPGHIPAGRRVDNPVNLIDLAPTMLEAAGVNIPAAFTAHSLMPLLTGTAAADDPRFAATYYGLERHSGYRAGGHGYPCRAVRTAGFLYIRNYHAERWPNGDPPYFADPSSDTSAAKQWILAHQSDGAEGQRLFTLAYAKRPAEELYDEAADPNQFTNLTALPQHAATLARMRTLLEAEQKRTGDPRLTGGPTEWDNLPPQLVTTDRYPEFRAPDEAQRMADFKRRYDATRPRD